MAVARLVCGSCGGRVSPGDRHCPVCGEKVELPAHLSVVGASHCPACGHQNAKGELICRSCGAKLNDGKEREEVAAVKPLRERGRRGQKPSKASAAPAGTHQRRFEPWQIISGVALLALIGFLVSTELSREQPRSVSSSVPPQEPAGTMVPSAPQPAKDIAPLEKAVAQNPRDPQALLNLSNALHDNGAYAQAIETYKKYLTIVPNDPDARVDMGICYYELGRRDTVRPMDQYSQAIQEMQTALRKSPAHQPAAFNLGIVYLTIGEIDQSNKWFAKAVELNRSSDLGIRAQRTLAQHASIKKQ